jgi:hypothetical protein
MDGRSGDDETEDGLHQWDYLTRTFDGDLIDPRSPQHAATAPPPPPPPPPHPALVQPQPFYFRANVILDVSNPETLRLPRQMVSFIPRGFFLPIQAEIGPCILTNPPPISSYPTTEIAAAATGINPSWPPQPLHNVATPVVQFPYPRPNETAIERVNAMDVRLPMGWSHEYSAGDMDSHFGGQTRTTHASLGGSNNNMDDRKPSPLGNAKVGAFPKRLTQAIEQTAISRMALEVAASAASTAPPPPLHAPLQFINDSTLIAVGRPLGTGATPLEATFAQWPATLPAPPPPPRPSPPPAAAAALLTPPPPPPAAPPCKPFTPYNFFFRDERDNIILGLRDSDDDLPPPVCDFSGAKKERLLLQRWYVGS